MSYFFREKPRFSDKHRGNSEDEFLQKFKQHFDDKAFDPISKNSRDPTDKLRGNFDDDFLTKLKQHFDDNKDFESMPRNTRDPFERHSAFSRGFPFDDEGFNRRGDIRAHLDDLASRHPEFAEHLLGPPWGDIPFHGTLRNRRRGSSSNSHQGHPDEDARSQASGSSAASAASGASGVSSHGEPDHTYQQDTSNKIPHYGLRNTVDIGQHRHNMENQEKGDRGQRSMSAPPENRQPPEQSQQPSQGQNQRYISRVDITPQYVGQKVDEKNSNAAKQQPQPQQQQKNQTQSNVRHIPIFVEGRDKPVISKNVDEPTYTRQQSPSRFYQQPNFDAPQDFRASSHKPAQFDDFFNRKHRDWPPQFQDPFQDTFDHPGVRKSQQQSRSPFRQQTERQRVPPRDESPPQMHRQHHQRQQHQQHHQQQQQPPIHQEEPVPRQQIVPKDSLEKVAIVQKEVDSLTEQVKQWNGNSRKDKQYIYLDEMLTRELIKLDDIETEGKENVRQARKNAIKSIQDSISLLESKALLPGQVKKEIVDQSMTEDQVNVQHQNVENEQIPDESEHQTNKDAIPLPSIETNPSTEACEMQENIAPAGGKLLDDPNCSQTNEAIPMEAVPVKIFGVTDDQQISETLKDSQKEGINQNQSQEFMEAKEDQDLVQKKSPKKLKKTKKPTPVSMEPIPLPSAEMQS